GCEQERGEGAAGWRGLEGDRREGLAEWREDQRERWQRSKEKREQWRARWGLQVSADANGRVTLGVEAVALGGVGPRHARRPPGAWGNRVSFAVFLSLFAP